jgi:hypothetical protein
MAEVTLGAVLALRLLFGDGERLQVRAHDLDLPLDSQQRVFSKLDGFEIVDVAIADSKAGPFELSDLSLTRTTTSPYHLVTHGRATTSALVDAGIGGVVTQGENLLDSLLGMVLGPTDTSIPVSLDLELASDDGQVRVLSGNANVAGLDAAPLAELITSAVTVSI